MKDQLKLSTVFLLVVLTLKGYSQTKNPLPMKQPVRKTTTLEKKPATSITSTYKIEDLKNNITRFLPFEIGDVTYAIIDDHEKSPLSLYKIDGNVLTLIKHLYEWPKQKANSFVVSSCTIEGVSQKATYCKIDYRLNIGPNDGVPESKSDLWRIDGTLEGSHVVPIKFESSVIVENPKFSLTNNDILYFSNRDIVYKLENGGLVNIFDATTSSSYSRDRGQIGEIISFNNKLYIIVNEVYGSIIENASIWVIDQAKPVRLLEKESIEMFILMNNSLYFSRYRENDKREYFQVEKSEQSISNLDQYYNDEVGIKAVNHKNGLLNLEQDEKTELIDLYNYSGNERTRLTKNGVESGFKRQGTSSAPIGITASVIFKDKVYALISSSYSFQRWVITDGTEAETKVISDICGEKDGAIQLATYGDILILIDRIGKMYIGDGTKSGMSLVSTKAALEHRSNYFGPYVSSKGALYFLTEQSPKSAAGFQVLNYIKLNINSIKDKEPIKGSNSGGIDLSTRQGAYEGTLKFKPGTVGYGVNLSIGAIKYGFNSNGQAKIGELFNRADVQELLAKENTPENNNKVAQLEYNYWQQVKNDPNILFEDWAGGQVGTMFSPELRTKIQMGTAYAIDNYVDPNLLKIRDGIDQMKVIALYRVKLLELLHFKKE